MRRSRFWAGIAVAIGLLVLTACGDDDELTEPPDQEAPAPEEPAPETAAEEPAAEEPVAEEPEADEPVTDDAPGADGAEAAEPAVAVADSELGPILVDGDGRTVYLFEPDEQGDPTCEDQCAESWPPLPADAAPSAGEGADDELLGTVERADGTPQLTYDGWPLYHWAGDQEPGDVNGQGVNEVWWVLDADGAPIRGEPDAEAAGAVDY